jgi:hypothetical protein
MFGRLRKHIATIVVAGITAGVTAAVTGGGPAAAFHTDHKAYYRRSFGVIIAPGASNDARATCPPGTRALGGGGYTTGAELESSFPSSANNNLTGFKAWRVWASNNSESQQTLTAYVICADAGQNSSYPAGENPVAPA